MVHVEELQVFYRDNTGNLHTIKQAPSEQTIPAIKSDVAAIVQPLKERGNIEYYYLVVKVRKSGGGFGYRTMIPKTLLV